MALAALAGNHHFAPPITRLNPIPLPPPPLAPPLSLISSPTKLLGFCLQNSAFIFPKSNSLPYISTSIQPLAVSRFAGYISDEDGYDDGGDVSGADGALDISSIKSNSVRLIDQNQNMVGIVSKSIALQMAEDAELDLVVLSPDADPPVVKIMDYDKYRYEEQRKKKLQQKRSSANRMDLKEVKMGYSIDVHDYSVRLKAAQKFLRGGNKVKVIVNLKGRENQFRNNAIELIRRFQNDLGELASEESKNLTEKNIYIVLLPNKAALQKASEPPKEKEKLPAKNVSAGM